MSARQEECGAPAGPARQNHAREQQCPPVAPPAGGRATVPACGRCCLLLLRSFLAFCFAVPGGGAPALPPAAGRRVAARALAAGWRLLAAAAVPCWLSLPSPSLPRACLLLSNTCIASLQFSFYSPGIPLFSPARLQRKWCFFSAATVRIRSLVSLAERFLRLEKRVRVTTN